jgi:hypothetical protein
MEDFFKKFMSQQNADRQEEFTHQKFDEAPLAHPKFDSQPDEDDTFLTKTNIEGFPKAKKPSLFGNSESDIRPPKMAVPLAYTQDQPKSDEEDSEENEEEDRGPMTTAEVQEDKKIQKLKQLLSKNKEMTVILQKERTLRLKAEAKIGEIEKLQEFEQLQVNRRPKTATEGEQWKSKYVTIEKKLQDERLKTTRLKKDLDKSIRIIHKEVGEFSTLDELLEKENWKGRAEQIKNLKNKVED